MPTDVLQIKLETTGDGRTKATLAGVERQVEKTGDSADRAAPPLLRFADALKIVGGIAVGAAARGIVRTNIEFDRLTASLETVTGSADAAADTMDRLAEFASTTPFQITELTDAFIKLKALGLDPSEEAMRSYGNTASAMGKTLNDMIEAVADASTGEFERLKEFGIKAKTQGDQVTFVFQGVETTVRNSSDAIVGYLRNIGDEQFAGATARQADTLGGAFSNLEDAASQLARAIGEDGGLNDALRETAELLTESMQNWADTISPDPVIELKDRLDELLARRDLLRRFIADEDTAAERAKLLFQGITDDADARRALQALQVELYKVNQQLIEAQRRTEGADSSGGVSASPPGAETKPCSASGSTANASADLGEYNTHIEEYVRLQKDAAQVRREVRTEDEILFDRLERYDLMLEHNMLTQDEWARAVAAAHDDAMDKEADHADHAASVFEQIRDAHRDWALDFADTLLDTEASFDDFVNAILRQMARIAIVETTDPFWEMVSGGISSGLGSLFGGGRATGGPVAGGRIYEVNEKGDPELLSVGGKQYLLMGPGSGYVTPPGQGVAGSAAKPSGGGESTLRILVEGMQAPEAEVRRTQGPDGQEQIDVMVRESFRRQLSQGRFDRDLAMNAGTKRPAVVR